MGQQTTKLYAYDACEVTPWSVLLMSGDEPKYEESASVGHITVGGWARFRCSSPDVMEVVQGLRVAWEKVLSRKAVDRGWDHEGSCELLVIKRLLLDNGLPFISAKR